MKKGFIAASIAMLIMLSGCGSKQGIQTVTENEDGSIHISNIDDESGVIKYSQKVDSFDDVTVVNCTKSKKKNPVCISLEKYNDKDLLITFSCEMKFENPETESGKIIWLVNEPSANFPQVVGTTLKSGEWKRVAGTVLVHVTDNKAFYLNAPGIDNEKTVYYLRNFKLSLEGEGIGSKEVVYKNWMEIPSYKEAYKDIFDYVGFACEKKDLLTLGVQEGLKYHVDAITPGNEFKPDFLFGNQRPKKFEDFVAEDGKTYKMPVDSPKFGTMDQFLQIAKDNGLKIRGHVLVWHSQTPTWFFRQNFNITKSMCTAEEMTARQEWYIKTVFDHVAKWEAENNNGEHIIFAWDVVNEAAADGATDSKWLRGEADSKWYKTYKNESFIVNAFRFANKYAPKDVLLVYNDYSCYSPAKLKAICKIIDAIQADPNARIDAVGMQSHVRIDNPKITGKNSYESAVQTFISKGLDVQVTELDIANGKAPYSPLMLKMKYQEYYEMFINNRKTADKHGITGVTIWGLNDSGTWLNGQKEYAGSTQYPLLLNDDFTCKPAFYGVIDMASSR